MMRVTHGDDYAIACSPLFFYGLSAIANAVLRSSRQPCEMLDQYAINGGVDERLKEQIGPKYMTNYF